MSHPELAFLDAPAAELDAIVLAARARIAGRIAPTPLAPLSGPAPGVELRAKLECELEPVRAFKARGAWNHLSQLDAAGRRAGVVTSSSGNHAAALAWAAREHGVSAVVCMPENAYASKIASARGFGAEVLLLPTRQAAERRSVELAQDGRVLVPPYDSRETLAGQGTLVYEVLEAWPEVEAIVVPVGGGGLLAGCALAAAGAGARRGRPLSVYGVEPSGAASMCASLAAGRAIELERIDSKIQGLTPPGAGRLPFEVARRLVAGVAHLPDPTILGAQACLVAQTGWRVEPAGAAALAWVWGGGLASSGLTRICCVLSGGNPDPAQWATLRGPGAGA
jgi:threonine dehydratase